MKKITALLFLLLAVVQAVHAQQPGDNAPQPPAPAPAAPAPGPTVITKEQKIFVPFDKLEEVFGNEEQGVFLPYREFLEMWNKVNLPEDLKKKAPPVDGVLAAASYTGKETGDAVTLQAKFNFEALKDGWSKLDIGAAGLAIAEAKSNATLSYGEKGYEVIFPNKGSYTLDAVLYGRITHEGASSILSLPLPRTAASQFELTIPEKGLEFTITPLSAYTSTENGDGSTKLLVYFGGSDKVTITWKRKTAETALKPLLFADARTDVHITAGSVRTDAEFRFQILRAGVESLDVLAPADDQVLKVEGANIKEWTLQPGANGQPQRVHVALYAPAKESYSLKLSLEHALPLLPQKIALPLIQADHVEHQTGEIAIHAPPELVAEVSDLHELTQQAAGQTAAKGAPDNSVLLGEYRYLRTPYSAVVNVSEAKPQVDVTSETLAVVESDSVNVQARFHYNVKKAGIFSTQIQLPPGLSHVDATGDNVESSTVQKANGKEVLVVKFRERSSGEFVFNVTADAQRPKPDAPVETPVFQVMDVERQEGKIGIAVQTSLKANTADRGDLQETDVREITNLQPPNPDKTPLTLGFRFRGAARPARIQFELREPRVSAEVLTAWNLGEALAAHRWTINYHIEYAGVNEFEVRVPTAIAKDIEITGDNIKERTRTEPKDEKGQPLGYSVWTVYLQAKVENDYTLTLSHQTPRPAQKAGEIAEVKLETIRPLKVFRETGQVAVSKEGDLEITNADAKGLDAIDPKETSPDLQANGVFLAYKYAGEPGSLTLQVARNLFLAVPPAIVSYAVLTTVVAEDESETTEVIYWVRNNAQQFFSIELPTRGESSSKLLSDAFVNGEPQQPSRRPGHNELLIRLPSNPGNKGEAFPVRFVYETPSAHPGKKLGFRGKIALNPPTLSGTEALQTKWTLYLPPGHRYMDFKTAMRLENSEMSGWERFRVFFHPFVPSFTQPIPDATQYEQSEPPALPETKTPGFDTQIQREGIPVTLRRLDAPAPITVVYCSRGYAAVVEALFFLAALGCGLWLLRASGLARFIYFVIIGLGSLVIAGAVISRGARVWESIYLGVLLSAIAWIVWGGWKALRSIRLWRRKEATPHASAPSQGVPASAAAPPPTPAPAAEPPAAPAAEPRDESGGSEKKE